MSAPIDPPAGHYFEPSPASASAEEVVEVRLPDLPIHVGKAALHELLLTWLSRLAPGGRAVLVVHKHLGADSLHRWLDEQGYPTQRLASSKGYRILDVHPHR